MGNFYLADIKKKQKGEKKCLQGSETAVDRPKMLTLVLISCMLTGVVGSPWKNQPGLIWFAHIVNPGAQLKACLQ